TVCKHNRLCRLTARYYVGKGFLTGPDTVDKIKQRIGRGIPLLAVLAFERQWHRLSLSPRLAGRARYPVNRGELPFGIFGLVECPRPLMLNGARRSTTPVGVAFLASGQYRADICFDASRIFMDRAEIVIRLPPIGPVSNAANRCHPQGRPSGKAI